MSLKQVPFESTSELLRRLKVEAQAASIEALTPDECKLAVFITALRDDSLRTKLFLEQPTSLDAAAKIALAAEAAVQSNADLTQSSTVAAITQYHNRSTNSNNTYRGPKTTNMSNSKTYKSKPFYKRKQVSEYQRSKATYPYNNPQNSNQEKKASQSTPSRSTCHRCDESHPRNYHCFGKEHECQRCGRTGHIERCCARYNPGRFGQKFRARAVAVDDQHDHVQVADVRAQYDAQVDDMPSEDYKIDTVSAGLINNDTTKSPTCIVELHNASNTKYYGNQLATLDSGAHVSLIKTSILNKLGIKYYPDKKLQIRGADNKLIQCLGSTTINIKFNDKSCTEKLYVCPTAKNFILSWSVCRALGVLTLTVDSTDDSGTMHLRTIKHTDTNSTSEQIQTNTSKPDMFNALSRNSREFPFQHPHLHPVNVLEEPLLSSSSTSTGQVQLPAGHQHQEGGLQGSTAIPIISTFITSSKPINNQFNYFKSEDSRFNFSVLYVIIAPIYSSIKRFIRTQ